MKTATTPTGQDAHSDMQTVNTLGAASTNVGAVLPPSYEQDKGLNGLALYLVNSVDGNPDDVAYVVEILAHCKPRVIRYLQGLSAENAVEHTLFTAITGGYSVQIIEACIDILPKIDLNRSSGIFIALLMSLSEYTFDDDTDYAQEQRIAILDVTIKVSDYFIVDLSSESLYLSVFEDKTFDREGVPMIKNPDLAKTILGHPERSDEIINIMTERRTGDVSVIETILNSDVPAIAHGIL